MMVNGLSYTIALAAFLFILPQATSTNAEHPHLLRSFKIKTDQGVAGSCAYTVVIKTSCSSTSYTRDKVSLAFGDASGHEVYAARLDDPRSRTFERCSSDTFQIRGPCTRQICYLYLLRVGSDGWKPENVKVYGPDRGTVTFNFNAFVPNGVWYGFNRCRGSS